MSSYFAFNFSTNNEYEDYLSFNENPKTVTVDKNIVIATNTTTCNLTVTGKIFNDDLAALSNHLYYDRSPLLNNTVIQLNVLSNQTVADLSSINQKLNTTSNSYYSFSNTMSAAHVTLSNAFYSHSNDILQKQFTLSSDVNQLRSDYNTFASTYNGAFSISSTNVNINRDISVTETYAGNSELRTYPPYLSYPNFMSTITDLNGESTYNVIPYSYIAYGSGTYKVGLKTNYASVINLHTPFDNDDGTFVSLGTFGAGDVLVPANLVTFSFCNLSTNTMTTSTRAAIDFTLQIPTPIILANAFFTFPPQSALIKLISVYGLSNNIWYSLNENVGIDYVTGTNYVTQIINSTRSIPCAKFRFLINGAYRVRGTDMNTNYNDMKLARFQISGIDPAYITDNKISMKDGNTLMIESATSNITSFKNTPYDYVAGCELRNTNRNATNFSQQRQYYNLWQNAYGDGNKIRFASDTWYGSNNVYCNKVTCSGLWFDKGFKNQEHEGYFKSWHESQGAVAVGLSDPAILYGRVELVDYNGKIPWSQIKNTPNISKISDSADTAMAVAAVGGGLALLFGLGISGYLYRSAMNPSVSIPNPTPTHTTTVDGVDPQTGTPQQQPGDTQARNRQWFSNRAPARTPRNGAFGSFNPVYDHNLVQVAIPPPGTSISEPVADLATGIANNVALANSGRPQI